jgi:hypothetical protein
MTMDVLLFTLMLYFLSAKTLIGLDCIYEWNGRYLIRSRTCLPFSSTWVHPFFLFGWVYVAHLFFLYCPIMCLYVLSSVLWCPIICLYVLSSVLWRPLRFPHKTLFGSSLPPVVCRRAYVFTSSYLSCLRLFVFVCVYGSVQHIYCVLLLFLFFFVLCSQCCQFLWIVILWLRHRFSLM